MKESLIGYHNFLVIEGFKFGFLLFLFRELMFFFSIFWIFFDTSLVPVVDIGISWVPKGLKIINPFGLPLLNTFLLLRRAIILTETH